MLLEAPPLPDDEDEDDPPPLNPLMDPLLELPLIEVLLQLRSTVESN